MRRVVILLPAIFFFTDCMSLTRVSNMWMIFKRWILKIFGHKTWLSDLQLCINRKQQKLLTSKGFIQTDAKNGPGMGAFISFANENIEFELVNDRGFFSINIRSPLHPQESYALTFLIAIIKLLSDKKHFKDLTKDEKNELYNIKYDHSNPLKYFFQYYEDIITVLDEEYYEKTVKELNDFFSERGEWLFPSQET